MLSLPAYNPLTGERIKDVQLSGDMAPFFTVDGETGWLELRVALKRTQIQHN